MHHQKKQKKDQRPLGILFYEEDEALSKIATVYEGGKYTIGYREYVAHRLNDYDLSLISYTIYDNRADQHVKTVLNILNEITMRKDDIAKLQDDVKQIMEDTEAGRIGYDICAKEVGEKMSLIAKHKNELRKVNKKDTLCFKHTKRKIKEVLQFEFCCPVILDPLPYPIIWCPFRFDNLNKSRIIRKNISEEVVSEEIIIPFLFNICPFLQEPVAKKLSGENVILEKLQCITNDCISLIDILEENTSLKSLSIKESNLDALGTAGIIHLFQCNNQLTHVDIGENCIGDTGAICMARALITNNTIHSIYLTNCSIGETGGISIAEALEVNSALTTIHIDQNLIGTHGSEAIGYALAKNCVLKSLYIQDNRICNIGASRIAYGLSKNSVVNELSLSWYRDRMEGTTAIMDALLDNNSLKKLNLDYNELTDGDLALLLEGIFFNTSLKDLSLRGNKFNYFPIVSMGSLQPKYSLVSFDLGENFEDGTEQKGIAYLLEHSPVLKVFSLDRLGKFFKDIRCIGKYLERNTTLTKLDLSENSIGPAENILHKQSHIPSHWKVLAEVLHRNCVLTELLLQSNWMEDTGVKYIAGSLLHNSTLAILDISTNGIQRDGVVAISKMLNKNKSLKILYMKDNEFSDTDAICLTKSLKRNCSLEVLTIESEYITEIFIVSVKVLMEKSRE